MIHGVTPQMAKKILSKTKDGTLRARRKENSVDLEGYILSKKAFLKFKSGLPLGYRIEFA